jgi:hypothetical protein
MESNSSQWKRLYHTFKHHREDLSTFLKQNCEYSYLKDLFIQMEFHKKKTNNLLSKLFLGQIGEESNKQKAIYELPTNELLTLIQFICDYLQIVNIEELAAGQGLLSCMLKYKLGQNYNIKATDGSRWIETNSLIKYDSVEKKLFLNYWSDNTNFSDKLVIISWVPNNDLDNLKALISKKKPPSIMLIGEKYTDTMIKISNHLLQQNYRLVGIPCKQISYRDYEYSESEYVPTSSITFATLDDSLNLKEMLLKIKFMYGHCLCQKQPKYNEKKIIHDLVNIQIIPPKVEEILNTLSQTENINDVREFIILICKAINKKFDIPPYISNFVDLKLWYNKKINNRFPLLIHSEKKFKEYKNLMNILNSNNGVANMKQEGLLPEWILNREGGENYIWLDFSTENKKWKFSSHSFANELNHVMRHTNRPYFSFPYEVNPTFI